MTIEIVNKYINDLNYFTNGGLRALVVIFDK